MTRTMYRSKIIYVSFMFLIFKQYIEEDCPNLFSAPPATNVSIQLSLCFVLKAQSTQPCVPFVTAADK